MGGRIKSHMHKSKGKNKKNIGSQTDKENQSSHIPNDLIFNILPRLPVKSLVRFKCISKSWCSFISQLKCSNNKLLFSTEHCIYSVDIEVPNIATQQLYFPPLLGPYEIIGCCNGLLCVFMKNEDALVLCNPLTRTYRSILLTRTYRSILLSEGNPVFDHCDRFGFGYNQLTDDYKILRVMPSTLQLLIYSLNTGSCKLKKFTLHGAPYIYLSESATFVKGALYWDIRCNEIFRYWGIHCTNEILCYDLTAEKISVIQLPDNIGMTNDSFDLRDFGGSLSMIHYHYQSVDCIIDVWALEEDKWIKLISIPHPDGVWFGYEVPLYHHFLKPVCLMKDGQVLMSSDNPFYDPLDIFGRPINVFCLFSPEEKKFRKFEIGDIDIRYAARFHPGIIYTGTLVSPFRSNKTLSGALPQRLLETVRTKRHVCNTRTKCDHHPRVNWKQWERQDRTKKKGYKKVAIT